MLVLSADAGRRASQSVGSPPTNSTPVLKSLVSVLAPISASSTPKAFQYTAQRGSQAKVKSALKRYFGRGRTTSLEKSTSSHTLLSSQASKFLVFRNDENDIRRGQEVGMFVNQNTPLESISSQTGIMFSYTPPLSRLYFPLFKKFRHTPTGPVEVNSLTQVSTQSLYEQAFLLWSMRAQTTAKKLVNEIVTKTMHTIRRATHDEDVAQASLELIELTFNADNLQHFDASILKQIVNLIAPLPDSNVDSPSAVRVSAAKAIWTMSKFEEISLSMISLNVIPHLLSMLKSLGSNPLTTAAAATAQLHTVGALSRLLAHVTPHHPAATLAPAIAKAMSIAAARVINGALEHCEVSEEDEMPDEAFAQHYAAECLCYLTSAFPSCADTLAHPGTVSRLTINLRTSRTELLLCTTVTLSIIARDPTLRASISRAEAAGAFSALLDVCLWCHGLLEITNQVTADNDGPADAVPSILETAVIALWGVTCVVRGEEDLQARAMKGLSRDKRWRKTNRGRANTVDIASEVEIEVDDEKWMSTCQRLSKLQDPRVSIAVNIAATGVMSYMIQSAGTAFKFNTLQHVLALLEPWQNVDVRSNAAVCLARLCAAEMNVSTDETRHNKRWTKFCEIIMSGCGLDVMLSCAMHGTGNTPERQRDNDEHFRHHGHFDKSVSQLRQASACAVLYICAEFKGVVRRVQLSSIIGLLSCTSETQVQVCAAASLWCLSRNHKNRKNIGELQGCRKLLNLLLETDDISCKEWCSASLWLLSTNEDNATLIATYEHSISQLTRLTRPSSTWDAHGFIKKSMNSDVAFDDILAQNCVGALRRIIVTEPGRLVVQQQKLGFTLLDTLFSIMKMNNVKIELLREAAGLIFFLQETPENLEYIALVTESSTALEDTFMGLLDRHGEGEEFLHMEAAHALCGLSCKATSKLHIGRNGGVKLLFKMLKNNLRMLGALDKKFNDGDADVMDVEEFDELSENMRICLMCTLNLSTEEEFHWDICRMFLKMLIEMAYDEDEKDLGKLCCKIICNLEKSPVAKVSNFLYREQLRLVSYKVSRIRVDQDEFDNNSVQGSLASTSKFGDVGYSSPNRGAVNSKVIEDRLKGTMCPDWFVFGDFAPTAVNETSTLLTSYIDEEEMIMSIADMDETFNMVADANPNEGGGIGDDERSFENLDEVQIPPVAPAPTPLGSSAVPSAAASLTSMDAYGREITFVADSQDNSLAPPFEGSGEYLSEPPSPSKHSGVPMNTPDPRMGGVNVTFNSPSTSHKMIIKDAGIEVKTTGVGITHTMQIPRSTDPWKPPAILQVLEEKEGAAIGKPNLKILKSETMILNPSKKYSRITFKTGVDTFGRRKQFNHREGSAPVTMWRWQHTPGALVSQENFTTVHGLDGEDYFYYYREDGSVFNPVFETEHPGFYPAPHPPVSVVYIGSKFPSPPRGLLPGSDTTVPHFAHPTPPECPRPKVHAIKLCREACTFINGQGNCPGKSCKMHGQLPIKEIPFYCLPQPLVEVEEIKEVLFDFNGTIFEDRKNQCNSKDFYNTDRMFKRSFEHDWSRGAETKRFMKFLTLSDLRVKRGEEKVQEIQSEVKKVMKGEYRLITQIYEYYAIMAMGMAGYGSGAMCIHQNGYMNFLKELRMADPIAASHIDDDEVFQELIRVFLTVNLEEDKTAVANKFNLNTAILKHEWIETLVRVAVVVYGSNDKESEFSKVSVCLEHMVGVLGNKFPAEITRDNDIYRKGQLYTHQVCRVLEKYKAILNATFIVYPVSNHKMRTKKPDYKLELFGLDDWERLLSDTQMYQKGIARTDAKAAFMRARMHVTDEIIHRDLYSSLTLIDFYEALARLADYWACGGFDSNVEGANTAENLDKMLKVFVEGLAVAWKGELRCQCHGHAWDQKKFIGLERFLPKEDFESVHQHMLEEKELSEQHILARKRSSSDLNSSEGGSQPNSYRGRSGSPVREGRPGSPGKGGAPGSPPSLSEQHILARKRSSSDLNSSEGGSQPNSNRGRPGSPVREGRPGSPGRVGRPGSPPSGGV